MAVQKQTCVASAVLLLAIIMQATLGYPWNEVERREPSCSNYQSEAAGCLQSFQIFAAGKQGIKALCQAYRQSEPCMKKLLDKCGMDPDVKSNQITKEWEIISPGVKAYCP